MIEFIQNLSGLKSQQSRWQQVLLNERMETLQSAFTRIHKSLLVDLSQKADFQTPEIKITEVWWANFNKIINLADHKVPRPTGLLTFVIEPKTPLFVIWNGLAKALLAGNAINVFNFGEPNKYLKILSENLGDLPVRFFSGQREFLEVTVNHPSVQGVLFNGSQAVGQAIVSDPRILNKKLQLTMGVHNTALILGEAEIGHAAPVIAQIMMTSEPHWPISVAEVFVLESCIDSFIQSLESEIQRNILELNRLDPASGVNSLISIQESESEAFQATKKKLKSEPGQYLLEFEKMGFHVVKDFSHCSSLHQESFSDKILLIQPVKYSHEMVKWVNAIDFGLMSLIFGPEDKVYKFGSQLPVNQIVRNGWFEKLSDIPIGKGRHFIGIGDQNFDGFFFSCPQKFDGLN